MASFWKVKYKRQYIIVINLMSKNQPLQNRQFGNTFKGAVLIYLVSSLALGALGGRSFAAAKKRAAKHAAAKPAPAAAPDPASMTPVDHNNRAVALGQRGLWPQAIAEHIIALNADPENPDFKINLSGAYLHYGQALAAEKKYDKAATQLRLALYTDPSNAEAVGLLNTCVKAAGHDPKAHMKRGDDLESDANYPEAVAEYRLNLEADDSGMAHWALGRALIKQGANSPNRLYEGYARLKIALNKHWDPSQQVDLAQCHTLMANVLKDAALVAREHNHMRTALKRLENASIEYRRAVQLNPASTDAIAGLIEVAREAVALQPSFDNHLMLGSAYLLRSDFDRAKQQYEECFKLNPNAEALDRARRAYHLAIVSSSLHVSLIPNSLQKAEENLRRNPKDAEWLYIYGLGKEQLGDREQALRAYQLAAQINPAVNPKLEDHLRSLLAGGAGAISAADAASTAGGASKQGDIVAGGASATANGSATTSSAGGAKPDDKSAAAGSGEKPATQPSGMNSTPAGTINTLVASAQEQLQLGAIEGKMRAGDDAAAEKELMAMIDKNPGAGHAWLLLARLQEKKGNLDEASVDYRQAALLREPEAESALKQIDSSRVYQILQDGDKKMKDGNYVSAAAAYKEALSVAPSLPMVHARLADALDKLGDKDQSTRERKKAADLEKGSR